MPHYLAILENNKEILFEDVRDFDQVEDHWWQIRQKLDDDDYFLALANIEYDKDMEKADTIGLDTGPKLPKPHSARKYLVRYDTLRIHVGAIKGIAQVIVKTVGDNDDVLAS